LYGASNLYTGQINYAIINSFLQYYNERTALIKINYTIQNIPENITIPYNTSIPGYRLDVSLRDFLEKYLIGIAKPVNISIEEIKPEALTNRSTILGWYTFGAIGMMYLYSGFSIGALIIVEEREKKTLKRILSTPITAFDLLIDRTLSGILTLMISTVIAIYL